MRRNSRDPIVLLKKKMHRAEIYQKWIYIPAKIREEFPPGSVVNVKAGRGIMSMRINKHNYMCPETALWTQFESSINFSPGHDVLVFLKHQDGSLEIACEKGSAEQTL